MIESSDEQDRAMKSSRHACRGKMRTFCEQVMDALQADHCFFLQSQVAVLIFRSVAQIFIAFAVHSSEPLQL